jgi:hypothetical protein
MCSSSLHRCTTRVATYRTNELLRPPLAFLWDMIEGRKCRGGGAGAMPSMRRRPAPRSGFPSRHASVFCLLPLQRSSPPSLASSCTHISNTISPSQMWNFASWDALLPHLLKSCSGDELGWGEEGSSGTGRWGGLPVAWSCSGSQGMIISRNLCPHINVIGVSLIVSPYWCPCNM